MQYLGFAFVRAGRWGKLDQVKVAVHIGRPIKLLRCNLANNGAAGSLFKVYSTPVSGRSSFDAPGRTLNNTDNITRTD
jgi:hypothetical protein